VTPRRSDAAASGFARGLVVPAIQPTRLSVRALTSAPSCGHVGPLLTTATSTGAPPEDSRKYGPPESC